MAEHILSTSDKPFDVTSDELFPDMSLSLLEMLYHHKFKDYERLNSDLKRMVEHSLVDINFRCKPADAGLTESDEWIYAHVEVQLANIGNAPLKMLDGALNIACAHQEDCVYITEKDKKVPKLPDYRIMFYIGPGECTMTNSVYLGDNKWFYFDLVVLNQMDLEPFLNSNEPKMVVIGMLAKHIDPQGNVVQIVDRLAELAVDPEQKIKLFTQVAVYSIIRKQLDIAMEAMQTRGIGEDLLMQDPYFAKMMHTKEAKERKNLVFSFVYEQNAPMTYAAKKLNMTEPEARTAYDEWLKQGNVVL